MKDIKTLLSHVFFKSPKNPSNDLNIKSLVLKVKMNLAKKDYEAFCKAFDRLVSVAENNEDAREYVIRLHNKITQGATARILGEGLELKHLKVSESNFRRFQESAEEEAPLTTENSLF